MIYGGPDTSRELSFEPCHQREHRATWRRSPLSSRDLGSLNQKKRPAAAAALPRVENGRSPPALAGHGKRHTWTPPYDTRRVVSQDTDKNTTGRGVRTADPWRPGGEASAASQHW
eukprot:scaffold36608_cov78-Phaeocystis_antarctica.AAC.1